MLTDMKPEKSLTEDLSGDKKRITVYLPSDVHAELKRFAKGTGRTISMTLTMLAVKVMEDAKKAREQGIEDPGHPTQDHQKIHSHTPGRNRKRKH